MKVAILVLLGLAGAPVAAQSQDPKPASRPGDPRARWNSLSEAERDRYRKMFEELQKLPPEKREVVKERLQSLSAERKKVEERLTPEERAGLDSLDREARENWLRKAAAEMLRSRHERADSLVPHEHAEGPERRDPKDRGEAVRKFSEEAKREAVKRVTDSALRHKMITNERADEIRAMPLQEAVHAATALRKDLIVADLERNPGKRAEISDEEWDKMKALSPERFLERLEMSRAFPRTMGPGAGFGAGPDGKRLPGPFWKQFHGRMKDREGKERAPRDGGPQSRKGI
jgi:hypothetical protein